MKPLLGFTPVRLGVFKQAFYHRSMNVDQGNKSFNNERLEYLGDAILSTIVAEYLFKKYPGKDEGFLTKMRSKIVRRQTLNEIADKMGLDLILSEYSQGKMSNTMLGNALEAMVGALYLEFGYQRTSAYVIKQILMRYLDIHALEQQNDNHKSIILEWSQKNGHEVEFVQMSKVKNDKRDYFRMAVMVDGDKISEAEDFNKKAAEQRAAELAILELNI
ncbi:MAG: ribonuclease III [Saprospiraceae bacterium]|nr:ribonuclease III [Saprospiraceae bacterium]MBK7223238.1 ribonuclease III [Saprospiraceae bacterium]MBK7790584.1 ribonuclease III [Saprospiraceae bacterium]MBK8111527.1 ribonuclease III [Saprospiraceae bacterium]MBK8848702.1 ribonuclease III [Saprospiraceae bacterium]